MSVSDKTAVVTGAGSKRGIGRATAHALAAAGWNVAVLDLDEAGAKDVADEIAEQHGVQAVGVGCDVTDAASVETALATVAGAVPPVGAVVNNAGITSPIPFLEVTAEEWERMFAVNVARLLQRHPPARARHGRARLRPDRVPVVGLRRARRRRLRRASPTPRPRPPSSASPAPWPASSARTASRSTPSPPA